MKVNIVTIGSTPHAKWGVKSDMVKIGGNTFLNFFLQSDDKKVLQKIKIGGGKKEFPHDADFNADDTEIVSGTIEQDGISIQELELPFGSVYVNPKNLNPYLANYEEDANCRLIVLLMGNDYRYLRSNINHELGEIISTFHTPTAVACVIKVYNAVVNEIRDNQNGKKKKDSSSAVNVLMVDTVCDNEFTHFRINLDEDENKNEYVAVTKSFIKKPDLVKRLSSIDKKMTEKKTARRFVRFSDAIITTHLVIPSSMSQEEAEKIVNMHSASTSLTDSVTYSLYCVDVDEKGFIIENETLTSVLDTMVENKVKALTLIKCRVNRDSFGRVRPLYIFSFDSTEDVSKPDNVKPIKCVKSN